MGVLMETHYCHLAHITQDLTTTAQQHAQSWRSDDSSPWTSHHPSVSQQGHPRPSRLESVGGSSHGHSTRDYSRHHHKVNQQQAKRVEDQRGVCLAQVPLDARGQVNTLDERNTTQTL